MVADILPYFYLDVLVNLNFYKVIQIFLWLLPCLLLYICIAADLAAASSLSFINIKFLWWVFLCHNSCCLKSTKFFRSCNCLILILIIFNDTIWFSGYFSCCCLFLYFYLIIVLWHHRLILAANNHLLLLSAVRVSGQERSSSGSVLFNIWLEAELLPLVGVVNLFRHLVTIVE